MSDGHFDSFPVSEKMQKVLDGLIPVACTVAATQLKACRLCGSTDLADLFSLGNQFVSAFVDNSSPPPVAVPIEIVMCRFCNLVQQRWTVDANALYGGNYPYRSGVTQTMRDALRDITRAVEERIDLRPSDLVIDIGSNDGTLLRSYSKRCIKVGIEPAANFSDSNTDGAFTLIRAFWKVDARSDFAFFFDDSTCIGKKAKAITAAGMFYDLPDPSAFIADVAKILAPDGLFVAQLTCLKQTVEKNDVGNFCHEHLEFYSLTNLKELFRRHGLFIQDIEENAVNGGSYRLYVMHQGCGKMATGRVVEAFAQEARMRLDNPRTLIDWAKNLDRQRDEIRAFIFQEVGRGKTVYVLGASTKGNCIVQWLGLDHKVIAGASDRSPEKVGKRMVGGGIPIFSEEHARDVQPDYFLVLPWGFRDELLQREAAWRARGGRFIFPLPTFEVV